MDHIRFVESLLMILSKGKLSESPGVEPFSSKNFGRFESRAEKKNSPCFRVRSVE